LSNLSFNGIPLALVIDQLLVLGGHQLGIVLRPSQTWAAQTDSPALAVCTVRSCAIDLVSPHYLRILSMATPIGHRLSLQVFSFVVGVVTEPIEEGESLTCNRD
jgi:hypothetical protein